MLDILKNCAKKGKVVSLYFNKEDNQVHSTGYVHRYNENEIIIAHINPRGEYDGFILNRIDDIYRIEFDGDYERKIRRLYKLKKQKHNTINCAKESLLFDLLDFAKDNEYLISLEFNNDSVTGTIDFYDENYICLNVIDAYGKQNGTSVAAIDQIVTISCDTDYEQDVKLLTSTTK